MAFHFAGFRKHNRRRKSAEYACGMTIVSQWEVVRKLGSKTVTAEDDVITYVSKRRNTEEIAAVKTTKKNVTGLINEAAIMKTFRASDVFGTLVETHLSPHTTGLKAIVMKLEGPSLEQLQRRYKRFSLNTLIQVGDQMNKAIQLLHSYGFAHGHISLRSFVFSEETRTVKLVNLDKVVRFDPAQGFKDVQGHGSSVPILKPVKSDPTIVRQRTSDTTLFEKKLHDDFLALLYVMLCLRVHFNWAKFTVRNRLIRYSRQDLLRLVMFHLPKEFRWLPSAIEAFKYGDTRIYEMLNICFAKVKDRLEITPTSKLDWEHFVLRRIADAENVRAESPAIQSSGDHEQPKEPKTSPPKKARKGKKSAPKSGEAGPSTRPKSTINKKKVVVSRKSDPMPVKRTAGQTSLLPKKPVAHYLPIQRPHTCDAPPSSTKTKKVTVKRPHTSEQKPKSALKSASRGVKSADNSERQRLAPIVRFSPAPDYAERVAKRQWTKITPPTKDNPRTKLEIIFPHDPPPNTLTSSSEDEREEELEEIDVVDPQPSTSKEVVENPITRTKTIEDLLESSDEEEEPPESEQSSYEADSDDTLVSDAEPGPAPRRSGRLAQRGMDLNELNAIMQQTQATRKLRSFDTQSERESKFLRSLTGIRSKSKTRCSEKKSSLVRTQSSTSITQNILKIVPFCTTIGIRSTATQTDPDEDEEDQKVISSLVKVALNTTVLEVEGDSDDDDSDDVIEDTSSNY